MSKVKKKRYYKEEKSIKIPTKEDQRTRLPEKKYLTVTQEQQNFRVLSLKDTVRTAMKQAQNYETAVRCPMILKIATMFVRAPLFYYDVIEHLARPRNRGDRVRCVIREEKALFASTTGKRRADRRLKKKERANGLEPEGGDNWRGVLT